MKTAQDILLAPVITEKSSGEIADGKYTFKVAVDATKTEVKKAVAKKVAPAKKAVAKKPAVKKAPAKKAPAKK